MKRKPPIEVAGVDFASQSALRNHARALLHKTQIGETFDEADNRFLLALLNRHHEAEEKIGAGIIRFFTRRHATYGTVGFAFERIDGSIDDFGIDYCVRTLSADEVARLNYLRAARYAVLPSIRRFRDDALLLNPICPLTGTPLTRARHHVDHAPPQVFSLIAQAYLDEVNLRPIDFEYRCDDLGRCLFADEYYELYFAVFHDERATLRLLSPSANLSGGRWCI